VNLRDVRDAYKDLSGLLSTGVRALAFSGIAVVWVFAAQGDGGPRLPRELLVPTALIVVTLALDFLQYAISTAIWGIYGRYREKKGVAADTEFLAPGWFNWPAIVCLTLKSVTIIAAYVLLLRFLWRQLFC